MRKGLNFNSVVVLKVGFECTQLYITALTCSVLYHQFLIGIAYICDRILDLSPD